MSVSSTESGSAGWDDSSAERWLTQLEAREASLAPVLHALLEAAALQPGERVLDVGCGAGPSTLAAAERVGPDGRVTGVDIWPGMIEAARQRAGAEPIDWLAADAEDHPFAAASFDVVISRFGVMFFADPRRAFANLATACRSGGRLVAAVWPVRDRSAYFARPLEVLLQTGQRLGMSLELPPADGGPFSLGDPTRTRDLLSAAGWVDVDLTPDHRALFLSGPGGSDEEAVDFVLTLGPARTAVENQPVEVVDVLRAALLEAMAGWREDHGVGLPGNFLVVTARRP